MTNDFTAIERSPSTPRETLAQLAHDEDIAARRDVARHPATAPEGLGQLSRRRTYDARIHENGMGFPEVGDHVTDGDSIYRVTWVGSHIHTDMSSRGYYVAAVLEDADWADCAEEDMHSGHPILTPVG